MAVFYGLLYRTAITGTCREIEKTKAFVNMLPVQVLTREVLLFSRWVQNSNFRFMVKLGSLVTCATNCIDLLPLQEVEYVMIFFLPEGLDDEDDAMQATEEGLELKECDRKKAAAIDWH